jgi:hypothetical protein
MDRTSSFPKQDFDGMVFEIWSGLDICLYHAAYVKTYAESKAMRLAGSRIRETTLKQMSQADRAFLQEDMIVFRAHLAGVLWQVHHLADELVRLAYRRCYQEDIVTKQRYDELVKALDDDPLLKEIRDYRNLSHQFAGVVVTLHEGTTDAFIAHILPPLDVQAPAQRDSLDEKEIQKAVKESELNTKLKSYCDHVAGYCEGLFRIIDTKYKVSAIPRSSGFVITIPHSYHGQLPEGAEQTIYVKAKGSAN